MTCGDHLRRIYGEVQGSGWSGCDRLDHSETGFSEVLVILVVSLWNSESSQHFQVDRNQHQAFIFGSWKEIRCMWDYAVWTISWFPELCAKQNQTLLELDVWDCVGIHGIHGPRLLLQGPLDRWRVDPFGQIPQTPGATAPRTEYGPPALAGERDTWRFVELRMAHGMETWWPWTVLNRV